jgi:pyridoxamine 5'-phosphate oxidase
VVYSNFGTSNKSKDLEGNKFVSLAFWWHEVERQVRVEGKAERMSREESQVYYSTRGRASKIGAWASEQSRVLEPSGVTEEIFESEEDDGRSVLDARVKAVEERFKDTKDEDIPVPDFWGGLKVVPDRIEFWQGRDSRLHDRFVYVRKSGGSGEWSLERLSP